MSNGISFAGQMLIPIYLIRGCGQSPECDRLAIAPLGLGMICSYPWMGALTQRFGIRRYPLEVRSWPSLRTLPFLYLPVTDLFSPCSHVLCSCAEWA